MTAKITSAGQKPLFCIRNDFVYAVDLTGWEKLSSDELEQAYTNCEALILSSKIFWLCNEPALEHWSGGMTEITMTEASALIESVYNAHRSTPEARDGCGGCTVGGE